MKKEFVYQIQKVLHVPGNYRGGILEMALVADYGLQREKLEEACFDTLNEGIMTKDLVGLVEPDFKVTAVTSAQFLDAIAERLAKKLA